MNNTKKNRTIGEPCGLTRTNHKASRGLRDRSGGGEPGGGEGGAASGSAADMDGQEDRVPKSQALKQIWQASAKLDTGSIIPAWR